jgi:protein involved in polysaccharide export with SLBB domain
MVRGGRATEPLVVPILSTIDSRIENGPTDYANAISPRPSDLITNTNDYTIGRNDLLNISISDLMAPGQETVKTSRVSESGNISLPYLGAVHAAGLTEIELEQAIVQSYRDANLIQNSQVSVTVVEARGRTVEILGAVQQPGQYAILDADFRLLDALVQAKDVSSPLIEWIYVIRKSESQRTGPAPTSRPIPNIRTGKPASAPTPDDLAPPKSDAGGHQGTYAKASTNRPLTLLADAPAAELAPAAVANPTAPVLLADGVPHKDAPFEFKGPSIPGDVHIIRIPYQALHAGELSYNIAIHPRDIVVVQTLPVGEYYMGGHVTRPGVYTLTGRRITLKQSVVSAGMFDDLAIPQRTDIIRRIKPDREVFVRVDLEKIFAGEQPDLYLKPDDQIMVGTNALAPFLSAARGAFRLTYGFGFLYDRNFAYSSNTLGF